MIDLLSDNTLEGALACEEAAVLLAERGFFGEARPLFKIALETQQRPGADKHLKRGIRDADVRRFKSRSRAPRLLLDPLG